MRRHFYSLFTGALLALLVGCNGARIETPGMQRWAEPMRADGVDNLHRVHDALYRGAQPADEGYVALQRMGIKTIINLRAEDGLVPAQAAPENEIRIRTRPWRLDDESVEAFLRATLEAEQPVFVHCAHGADRTGAMVAMYRIVVEGWSKADAVNEMTRGGFEYHPIWFNLVDYVQGAEVAGLRERLCVAAATRQM